LSPTHEHFVGVSRKRPASAHHWLDLVRAQIPLGAMSVGEVAQITAAFVVVLAPLNWTILNGTPMGRTLMSRRTPMRVGRKARMIPKRSASECEGA
jgi:hypothetical protein